MKKNHIIILVALVCGIISLNIHAQIGRLKTTPYGHTLIGYQTNWFGLSFGTSNTTQPHGEWNIQYYPNSCRSGLNFWKPGGSFKSADYKLHINNYGHVGINIAGYPFYGNNCTTQQQINDVMLQVNGAMFCSKYWTISDSVAKTNMVSLPSSTLSKLLALNPIEYTYKTDYELMSVDSSNTDSMEDKAVGQKYYINDHSTHFGFTAQDLGRVFPNLTTSIGNTAMADYVEVVPLLVKGVQEQQKMIDTLRKINDSLNLQIQNLRQEIVNWKGQTLDTPADNSRLFQNNPNPFDGITTINYYIDETTTVSSATIEIRNIMGTLQTTLTLADISGIGSIDYNGASLNQGYYIYTLKINGSVKDSKMFLKEL